MPPKGGCSIGVNMRSKLAIRRYKENIALRVTGELITCPKTGKDLPVLITRGGTMYHQNSKLPLQPLQLDRSGYAYYNWNGNTRLYPHKYVAAFFIPLRVQKGRVWHIDGCPYNNAMDNLTWVLTDEQVKELDKDLNSTN